MERNFYSNVMLRSERRTIVTIIPIKIMKFCWFNLLQQPDITMIQHVYYLFAVEDSRYLKFRLRKAPSTKTSRRWTVEMQFSNFSKVGLLCTGTGRFVEILRCWYAAFNIAPKLVGCFFGGMQFCFTQFNRSLATLKFTENPVELDFQRDIFFLRYF